MGTAGAASLPVTQKPLLHGTEWVAITGKPLATTTGAKMFINGSNAVDAACAINKCVEGVLHKHPDIEDVALIGLPKRSLGEEVAAVINVKAGRLLSEGDVQTWVAERLARFNVPTKVFFLEEPLPRTATGKVLKRELKERFGGA